MEENSEVIVQEEETQVQEEIPVVEPKLSRKEKRFEKLKNKILNKEDIKYQGPLSYRALRIIAWLSVMVGQMILFRSIGAKIGVWTPFDGALGYILPLISALSTPLFIIASFGLVLSGHRKYLNYIVLYAFGFLGMGLGFVFFYIRYVNGLFVHVGIEQTTFFELVKGFYSDHVQINVFSDLLAFTLFHYFINYNPKKAFTGKKIIIFRLFAILPVAFVITSYVFHILLGVTDFTVPFFIYPFLGTKSPLIFLIFCVASLWIKNRERLYLRIGATKKEYREYLKTNRNSLSISTHLVLLIGISVIVDFIFAFVLVIAYAGIIGANEELWTFVYEAFEVGQTLPLVLAIPFILLYSYTRNHKNTAYDIIIPIVGIGLSALVYVEGAYQLILSFTG